ncbi:MAG: cyclase [Isosphaera sp.]|nr:cyclase [Isosphaera sp.]
MAATLLSVAAKSAAGRDSAVARAVDALPQVRTNLSSPERWVSLAAGGALFGLGFDGRGPGLLSCLAGTYLLYRAATGNCLAYQALGFSTSDATAPASVIAAEHGTRVEHVVTVMKPADQVYRFWRDFENLPRFMTHLVDVDTTTDGRSRWVAKGPLGLQVEWEAELLTDTPNRVIAWKSVDGSDVDTAGSVRFTDLPHGQGTEVRVELKYDPPGGKVGSAVARLFGENPDRQVREDLRRFKQILETGETPTTEGQPHGRR